MESYELSTPLTSPGNSPVLPRNPSFHRKSSGFFDENDFLLETLDDEDFTELPPIPQLNWWNPVHWKSILKDPLNPVIIDTGEPKNWHTYQRWENYRFQYRSAIATQFSRLVLFPTTLFNLLMLIKFKTVGKNSSQINPRYALWKWIFCLIPLSEYIIGELLYPGYPFLLSLIYEILGFFTAIVPLYRLISSQKMSLLTCIGFWYFSFLTSLSITSANKQDIVLDRYDLCKKALNRTMDYIKWPLSIVWIVSVLILGPVISTGILMGLIIRFLVGKIKRLSIDNN